MLAKRTHPNLNRAARRHPAKAAGLHAQPANTASPLLQSLFVNAGIMEPEQDFSAPYRHESGPIVAGSADFGIRSQGKSILNRLRGFLKLS